MAWDELSDVDKAWIAGIFEGEGTIGVWSRYKDKKYIRMNIYNNDVTMLEELQRLMGGYIYERKMSNPRNLNWKPSFQLSISKVSEVERFVEVILPFVRSSYKRDQIMKSIGVGQHGMG